MFTKIIALVHQTNILSHQTLYLLALSIFICRLNHHEYRFTDFSTKLFELVFCQRYPTILGANQMDILNDL